MSVYETTTTTVLSRKRGRKVSKENYFDVEEEMAVRMYLTATTFNEKNQIYNEYLRGPLDKMISSIIRRYKLYRKDMDFKEIHTDTHSFLMTKIDKFKPSKEKKAYSYFGTICKNYLMGQIIKDQKDTNRKVSYEDISSNLENRPDMIYYLEYEIVDAQDIISEFLEELRTMVDSGDLSDNEKKLGLALQDLFENYKEIFLGNENNKFNKNVILLSLREMTNLSTKEIRSAIKKYKKLYYVVLNGLLESKITQKIFIVMPRPKKKEIDTSKDSILSLLQEVYNELVEQRSTALRVQNKMLAMLKDPEDMTLIGPVLEKQQKIINDVVEKKLTLAKLQTNIWEKSSKHEDDLTLSDSDEDMLQALLQKDLEAINQQSFKMK